MATTKYDYRKIEEILKDVMDWLGKERFSTMKVTELEQHVRNRESTVRRRQIIISDSQRTKPSLDRC
jgi:hypothetical protein